MALRHARRVLIASLALAACRTTPVPVADPPAEPRPEPVVDRPLPVPPAVAREFRGAWVTPLWAGEWPSRSTLTPEQQRAELARLLDRAQALGLNAIVLHVRIAADALYPSTRVPWSVHLTGSAGRAPEPFYDPLQFALNEAHARGLELHAWFNPFRAAPPDRRVEQAASHVSRRHPGRVVTYGTQLWIDPGSPQSRRDVLADILEVVDRYDIDGVHVDDYFYPYIEQRTVRGRRENIPFPDSVTWRTHGEGRFASRAAWRRANIDDFVRALHAEVKERKPWLPVGISPFGIWRPGSPPGLTGLDAYAEIYADARLWLRSGWLDYAAPQLYWPLAGAQSRFTRLDAWWREENVRGRHIWPGLHSELEAAGNSAWPSGEIARQIETLRAARTGTSEAQGHIHFRMKSFRSVSVEDVYAAPAIPPSYPWLGDVVPATPRVAAERGRLLLAPGDSVPVRWWLVQTRDEHGEWRTRRWFGRSATILLDEGVRGVAVRALTRTGIPSAPARTIVP